MIRQSLYKFAMSVFVLLSLIAVGTEASAQNAFPRLMTYNELLQLSPKNREAYLKGIREMLIEVSKLEQPNLDGLFADERPPVERYLDLLGQMIGNAAFADDEIDATVKDATKERMAAQHDLQVISDEIAAKQHWYNGWEISSQDVDRQRKAQARYDAALLVIQDIRAKHPAINSLQRAQVERDTVQKQVNEDKAKVEAAKSAAAAPTATSEEKQQAAIAQRNLNDDQNQLKVADKTVTTNAKKITKSDMAAAKSEATQIKADVAKKAADEEAARKRANDEAGDGFAALGGSATLPSAASTNCPDKPLACSDYATLDKAKQKQFKKDILGKNTSDLKSCNYGGMWSSYKGGRGGPGKCQPQNKFCFINTDCLSCKGSKAICNPMIFGIQSNGQPFCNKPTKSMSAECDAQASVPDVQKKDFITSKRNGIEAQWNANITQFNKVCGASGKTDLEKAVMTLNCGACSVMSKHIYQLNRQASGHCELKEAAPMGPDRPAMGPNRPTANDGSQGPNTFNSNPAPSNGTTR